MKILLVRPPDPLLRRFALWPPLGLAHLAASLPGHQVEILDALARDMRVQEFVERVLRAGPDAVGFSTLTQALPSTRACVEGIRAAAPQVITIMGGPHVSGDPRGTFRYIEELDYGLRGEADHALPALLELLQGGRTAADELSRVPGLVFRHGEEVRVGQPAQVSDLDALPRPARHLLQEDRYPRNMLFRLGPRPHAMLSVTRGCPRRCDFCGTESITGPGFRRRDLQDVLDEVLELRARRGVRTLLIVDDNLTADRRYALDLFELLASRAPGLAWTPMHGLRLDTLDEELVRAMERSGCFFFYCGVESGSQRVLDLMGKGTTVKRIQATVAMVRRVSQIRVGGFFVLGYPGETTRDIRRTVRLARRLGLDRAVFLPVTFSPGSPLYLRAERDGVLPDPRLLDYSITDGYMLVGRTMDQPQIPLARLKRHHLWAYASFYLDPRRLWRMPGQLSARGLWHATRYVLASFD